MVCDYRLMPFVSTLVKDPETYAETVRRIAKGQPRHEVAKAVGVSPRTIARFATAHTGDIQQERDHLKRIALGAARETDEVTGEERFGTMVSSLLRTATHGEERARASCARVYGELTGLIGNGPTIDNSRTVVRIDRALVALDGTLPPEELRMRLSASS